MDGAVVLPGVAGATLDSSEQNGASNVATAYLGRFGPSWHDHNKPGSMSQIRFGTLGVIVAPMSHGTTRTSQRHASAIPLIATAIPKFRHFIDNLIKRGKNVVGKLNLSFVVAYDGVKEQ